MTQYLFEASSFKKFQEPIAGSIHLPYKPLETTFARIFLFLDFRIPTNALSFPVRTKLLYYKQSRTSNRVRLTKYSKNKKIRAKVDSRI